MMSCALRSGAEESSLKTSPTAAGTGWTDGERQRPRLTIKSVCAVMHQSEREAVWPPQAGGSWDSTGWFQGGWRMGRPSL
jgi:hypothetical protein